MDQLQLLLQAMLSIHSIMVRPQGRQRLWDEEQMAVLLLRLLLKTS